MSCILQRTVEHPMDDFQLIEQGAEARLYIGIYLGKRTIVKERFQKKYRHPSLDSRLSRDRTKAEARAIVRAKAAGIPTPSIYLVDFDRHRIYMEQVENATTLKDYVDNNISKGENLEDAVRFIGKGVGMLIAKLHSKDIIHGDLTTSNVLLKQHVSNRIIEDKNYKALNDFIMIDFGLARIDSTVEDKAVDMYVLERSLLSAHSQVIGLFSEIFENYQRYYTNRSQCKEIISKYKEVRARGRKRLMVG